VGLDHESSVTAPPPASYGRPEAEVRVVALHDVRPPVEAEHGRQCREVPHEGLGVEPQAPTRTAFDRIAAPVEPAAVVDHHDTGDGNA
jgi:hypothetical protein